MLMASRLIYGMGKQDVLPRSLSAVLPGQPEVQEGARVRLGFDAGKTMWFDAAGARVDV